MFASMPVGRTVGWTGRFLTRPALDSSFMDAGFLPMIQIMKERRIRTGEPRWIPCRACGEAIVLDPERMERLAGRTYIECGSCRNLIWIRRGDLRAAVPVAAGRPGMPSTPPSGPTD
jgi:hypothetical protein